MDYSIKAKPNNFMNHSLKLLETKGPNSLLKRNRLISSPSLHLRVQLASDLCLALCYQTIAHI